MIRKIWLTNNDNSAKFEFTDFGDFIFSNPTSLGIYRQKEFLIVNNQRIETNDVPSFKSVTGTIIIKAPNKDLESKYALLRDFVSKYNDEGFRLYVKTEESKPERYIRCAIESVDKSEKSTANTMLIPISILPKSLWLGDVSGTSVAQKVAVRGMFRFINNKATFIKRDFEDEFGNDYYSMAFSTSAISRAFVFNGGEEITPLLIRVYGVAVNPHIKLKDYVTGEVLQDIKFKNLTIPQGSYLEVNSSAESAYVELVNSDTGERIDVEDFADQDSTIFMNLPLGSYIIEASDEVEANIVATRVFFTNQYKGA